MGMMLLQMNDTEKEGDGARAIINSKVLLLMFRSTSRSKKYAFEMLRLISKVKCQMTEQMAARTVYGRFVNWKGKYILSHNTELYMAHMYNADNTVYYRKLSKVS